MEPQRTVVSDPVSPAPALPRPVDLTPEASGYLDAVRALAALAVVIGHCRGLLFVGYSDVAPAGRTPVVKALYFLSGFGHQAVIAFFVLSGLFISSSVLRKFARGWVWWDYLIDRGVRLYVVLIPGLLMGGLCDFVGLRFFNRGGLYTTPLKDFGDFVVAQNLTLVNFIGNLLFLQTRFTPVFGSDGPLWSLYNEAWYYALFPLALCLVLSVRRRPAAAIRYAVLVAAVCWILAAALPGFLIWLAGGGVALAARRWRFESTGRFSYVLYLVIAAGMTVACLVAARRGFAGIGSDLALGATFALFTYALVLAPWFPGRRALHLVRTLAGFSYTLYVIHFPMLLLIRALVVPTHLWQPDVQHLLWALAIVTGVLLLAFVLAQGTEARTAEWRSRVRGIAG